VTKDLALTALLRSALSAFQASQAALQYLMWALEHVERAGNRKAADPARLAIKALGKIQPHKNDESMS
jgi:hypothetical protein